MTKTMKLIYSEEFVEFGEQGHPESPERLKAIVGFLKKKGMTGFVEPAPCTEEDLLRAHVPELVAKVKGNDFFDPDTPNIPGIYDYARLACGAAIMAAESALEGTLAFSLARPPGHHAGKRTLGGFCYFNNMAVAVKKLRVRDVKVAVLDLDGHHGNGTEEILAHEPRTLFISLHQLPGWPETGGNSFANCHNFPLRPGTDSAGYLAALEKALDLLRAFAPDVLGLSLGFDAHRHDPLLELPLGDSDYFTIGKKIRRLDSRFFVLLEGGYNTKTVGNACYCFIKGAEEKQGSAG